MICNACVRGFHKYHDTVARPACACVDCARDSAEKNKAKDKEKTEVS